MSVASDGPGSIAIATTGVSKRFGSKVAVEDLNLTVPKGAIYGLLGPNGAGKSTTVNMLLGLSTPSVGSVSVLGYDPAQDPIAVRRQVGVLPEGVPLFESLTGREHIDFCGRMYGVPRQEIERRSEILLQLLDLGGDADRPIGQYSTGMRRKLALSCAMVHGPPLLLLDEPFESLDPGAARVVRDVIADVASTSGTTVFLTSHALDMIERLCTHVGILRSGRLLAQGGLTALVPQGSTLDQVYFEVLGETRPPGGAVSWFGAR